MTRETKARRGRPTAYREECAEQARKLCRLGATDVELADFFEVNARTINRWKAEHQEFCQSLKAGKAAADAEVADRLYQRALGYSHPAVKIMSIANQVVREDYTEHYPPDTTAAIFWLKNRRPDLWRDRIDNTHSGPNGGPIQARITVEFVRTSKHEDNGAI
ncbi:helix-turn-helix domain-containing protein [Pseudothauera rhizosphaerae]|uniref:Helix-turn-helix domain-containing protein n=1 Tax=Pseudothauera rhizosphaerae TaxID=2565932 RepID=A0A4V3WBR7_9RHOO|nr:helix-turn-helix domain-containing protein [Pseudothauera rhizosphaerae]THF64256.1 helix-turn-helix domain-containing protein [Pseudothauera rhizosphaerae]